MRCLVLGFVIVGLTATGVSADRMSYSAQMSGDQVVPEKGPPGARGEALITTENEGRTVCYQLRDQGVSTPTMAHIHRGARGAEGFMAVDLDRQRNGDQGCVSSDPAVAREIERNPEGFYVDLHSTDDPGGAMRGQLTR